MKPLTSFSERVAFHKQRSHRLEELADGVFAITMTLLVLDIRLPSGEISTEHEMWLSLLHVSPKVLTFALSFLVAGLFWSVLINQFNYIRTADRNEGVIGLIYLLFVALLPFTTSLLGEHLDSRVAVGVYIANIILIAFALLLHWLYSYHNGLVKADDNDEAAIHSVLKRRAATALTGYGIAAICCVFSSYVALGVVAFIQVFFALNGFLEMLRKKAT